jgi:hypothetical protein
MGDFLAFRKMITPVLIQIVFWLGSIACVIAGIILLAGGGGYGYYGGGELIRPMGILLIIFGPLVVRIYCEIMILFFRMNASLTDIRAELKQQSARLPE